MHCLGDPSKAPEALGVALDIGKAGTNSSAGGPPSFPIADLFPRLLSLRRIGQWNVVRQVFDGAGSVP